MKYIFTLSVVTAISFLPSLPAINLVSDDEKKLSLADLPDYEKFKADPYLAAAAKLQQDGMDKAAVILADLAGVNETDEQVILLCRLLFKAKSNGEFRSPALGIPVFISPSTDRHDWPLEPIELVDGVPFLVVKGYNLEGGKGESGSMYLYYCQHNCDWKTETFRPKTLAEKQKAFAKLVDSPRWKKPLTEKEKKVLSAQIE
jgi:hypothetical protein